MELNERNAETKSGQDARAPRQITHGVIVGGEQMKHCPRCDETKPLWEFGICQARKDGMNLYCKTCIREKIQAGRVALREYKKARKQAAPDVRPELKRKPNMRSAGDAAWVRRAPNAAEKILRAIECGAKTQTAMRRITRLTSDAVSDAIADLMFPTDENPPRIAIRFSAPAEQNWYGDNHVYYRVAA